MLRSLILIALLFKAALASASTLLVVGDSLSAAYGIPRDAGWVALLEQRLQQEGYAVSVVNASISGETTQGGLSRLPGLLQRYQPDLVVLELGANDGLRGTMIPVIEQNLTRLSELSQAAGAEVLLLGMRLPPNYGPRYTEQFFTMYSRVADQAEAALVPFFMEQVALDAELLLDDGLHPNAKGQPYLLDTVWPRLESLLLQ